MKKKSLDEYKQSNEVLKMLNEERIKRKKVEEIKTETPNNEPLHFSDGRSIYLTPIDFLSPQPSNTITLRQLLYEDLQNIPNRQKTVQSCIMTTFCVENSFIAPIINQNFPFCLVVHSKSASLTNVSPTFTVISPSIEDKYGSFHAKIFLIKFPSRLRVVVTSANLITCDWSQIGQCVWFQDFYPTASPVDSSFKSSLVSFFTQILPSSYSLNQDLQIDLEKYDFSSSAVELVVSIPGRYPISRALGLSRVRELLSGVKYSSCVYQCSSIGSFNKKSFANLCKYLSGNENIDFKIVFPSIKDVKSSFLGTNGAGVFFMKRQYFESPGFPRESFCNFESPGHWAMDKQHLSHSKVMVLSAGDEVSDLDLVYFGSHNLSGAAWGVLEKGETQIYIKNYEIGIVFLPKEGSKDMKARIIRQMPFKYPPKKYEKAERPFYIDSDFC